MCDPNQILLEHFLGKVSPLCYNLMNKVIINGVFY